MDIARDNAGISHEDFETVFRYEEKETTVLRIIAGQRTWQLKTEKDWSRWLAASCPPEANTAPGLVLILARRTGEQHHGGYQNAGLSSLIRQMQSKIPGRANMTRAMTFASLREKQQVGDAGTTSPPTSGRRSLRTLPFSGSSFRLIAEKFCVHGSIAKVISRADIPVFSSARVKMREAYQELDGKTFPAYVTNCRTSNAWDMDLALTSTYFPHRSLTFGIVFGCARSVELEILQRLSVATAEAAYPLLMPGVFAELERSRHANIVETTVDELEVKILELDYKAKVSDLEEGLGNAEVDEGSQDKRNTWLDTGYLRNQLITWARQLAKMSALIDELERTVFSESSDLSNQFLDGKTTGSAVSDGWRPVVSREPQQKPTEHLVDAFKFVEEPASQPSMPNVDHEFNTQYHRESAEDSNEGHMEFASLESADIVESSCGDHLRTVGQGIKDRLHAIADEYDDKVRDCTMRMDGMAMATQWADGETNVQIALEMKRDSRHMRSIALVTMVFLPGTFFASVFSMTFFNWSDPDNHSVSSSIWIYLVFTICSTLVTLACWWYWVVYRQSRARKAKANTEEDLPLVESPVNIGRPRRAPRGLGVLFKTLNLETKGASHKVDS